MYLGITCTMTDMGTRVPTGAPSRRPESPRSRARSEMRRCASDKSRILADCELPWRYVHLSCLRKWQRTCLVSQPTHPAFYDRDLRHKTCAARGSCTY